MGGRRVGQAVSGARIAALAATARRYAQVGHVIERSVPSWLDSKDFDFQIASDATLLLRVTRSQMRMVRQILPSLRAALRSERIRAVRLAPRP